MYVPCIYICMHWVLPHKYSQCTHMLRVWYVLLQTHSFNRISKSIHNITHIYTYIVHYLIPIQMFRNFIFRNDQRVHWLVVLFIYYVYFFFFCIELCIYFLFDLFFVTLNNWRSLLLFLLILHILYTYRISSLCERKKNAFMIMHIYV